MWQVTIWAQVERAPEAPATHWAQTERASEIPATQPHSEVDVLMWGAILIVIVVLGAAFIMLLRRRLTAMPMGSSHEAGFSLADLRAMRDRGEITPEEYEQTRANVIAKVKKKAEEKPKAKPKPGESPRDPLE
jgi:hypothetical protein